MTKIENNKFKVGEIYYNDNKPEVEMLETSHEITLCKCTKIDKDWIYFTDFKLLEGTCKLAEWLYSPKNDKDVYDFYHVTKKDDPEYFL